MAILVLILVGVAIAGGLAALQYMVEPLAAASRQNRLPTQFTISDLLVLFIHLSIPLSLLAAIPRANRGDFAPLVFLLCIAAFFVWWGAVQNISRAGIVQPMKRLVAVALALPGAFVVAITIGPMWLVVIFTAGSPGTMWLLAPAITLCLLIGVLRRAVNWILSPPPPVVASADSWAQEPSTLDR